MIHKSCEAEMPSVLLNLTISTQSRPARRSAANTEEAETDQRSDVLSICKYLIKTSILCARKFSFTSLSPPGEALQLWVLQSDLSSRVSKICLKHVSQSGMDSLKKTAQNRPSRDGGAARTGC